MIKKYSISKIKAFILNKRRELNQGYTLIELIVYMGMLGILLTVLMSLFLSVLDLQLEAETTSSAHSTGQVLLAKLAYDIHRADSIITPSSITATSSSMVLNIDGVTKTYALTGGDITITDSQGTEQLNGYDTQISGLLFTRYGNAGGKNAIEYSFTVTGETIGRSGQETKDFSTTITLR